MPMQQPVAQQYPLAGQVTVLVVQVWLPVSQDESGQTLPTIAVPMPPPPRQSESAQQAPQTPLQHSGVEPAHIDV